MGNSTPCKIVTPGNPPWNFAHVIKSRKNVFNWYSGGFFPNKPNLATLWLVLTVLSCPVLTFFSITSPGRNAGPILRFMAQATYYNARTILLRLEWWWLSSFGGKYTSQNHQKWACVGNFKPKCRNIKIAIFCHCLRNYIVSQKTHHPLVTIISSNSNRFSKLKYLIKIWYLFIIQSYTWCNKVKEQV